MRTDLEHVDPTAALKEMLELSASIVEDEHVEHRLAELVLALNKWIEDGGYLPERWYRHSDALRTIILCLSEEERQIAQKNTLEEYKKANPNIFSK